MAEIVSETTFWSYNRVSDTDDDIFEVKLLFLASLLSRYLSLKQYKNLLGASEVSLEVFDNWWTIERYLIDDIFVEVEAEMDLSLTSYFVKTGRERVDMWIDKMKKKHHKNL